MIRRRAPSNSERSALDVTELTQGVALSIIRSDEDGFPRRAAGVPLVEVGKEKGMAIAHGLDIKGEMPKARTEWFFGLNLLADRMPELYGDISGMAPRPRT